MRTEAQSLLKPLTNLLFRERTTSGYMGWLDGILRYRNLGKKILVI